MTQDTTRAALPPLPAPHLGMPWRVNAPDGSVHCSGFTAEQMADYARAALAQPQQAAPAGQADTVPWPIVSRYSGGASADGVAGRVWMRLGDGPEETEYVQAEPTMLAAPARQAAAPTQPPYPEDAVVGPCVCGGWPGDKCLRCPWRQAPAAEAVQPELKQTFTRAELLAAIEAERHACSIAVWMTLQDALEPDADDKGLDGWMREAESRVKNRLAHHKEQAAPLTECSDNDSPWLICKPCAAAGACAKAAAANALQPMKPDQIERHIGADEGDRDAVAAIVREVEAWHGIGQQAAPQPQGENNGR